MQATAGPICREPYFGPSTLRTATAGKLERKRGRFAAVSSSLLLLAPAGGSTVRPLALAVRLAKKGQGQSQEKEKMRDMSSCSYNGGDRVGGGRLRGMRALSSAARERVTRGAKTLRRQRAPMMRCSRAGHVSISAPRDTETNEGKTRSVHVCVCVCVCVRERARERERYQQLKRSQSVGW